MLEDDDENENLNNEGEKNAELKQFNTKGKISLASAINSRKTEDSSMRPTELVTESEEEEEKTCSMKEGSVQGGVFALSSLALGTGAFSIPIRCTQIGLFWYIIFILVGAAAAYWTLTNLIKSAKKINGEDYSPSVKGIIGKCPAIFLDIVIIIYLFGVFIQYQVIIYSLIGRTYYELFGDKNEYINFDQYEKEVWDLAKLKFPIMFITTALVSPLCLLKDISKMRFASMFGVCALIYCIIVVVIQTPWFYSDYLEQYKEDDPNTHANWFDISKGFGAELNFFTGVATVFFTYSCHPGAFPVYKTLKQNNKNKINTVFLRSICLDLIIYIFIAICGFMTAPLKPQSLIIYRESVFENDIFMTIAKIALALDLFLSLPANYASYRCSFFMLVFNTDKIDNSRNFLITIPTLIISTLIGALYKDILSYISFFGGFGSSIMCYLIPGALMVKTSEESITSWKNIMRIIAITFLTTMGFMGGIQTIRNNINGTS